jgi:predicted PhzF superfamily epimerase YddE/YHI9
MQRIARWTSLSETMFTLRPTDPADYLVRIVAPVEALPLSATRCSAHAPTRFGRAAATLAHAKRCIDRARLVALAGRYSV